jgi:hypothetical protein
VNRKIRHGRTEDSSLYVPETLTRSNVAQVSLHLAAALDPVTRCRALGPLVSAAAPLPQSMASMFDSDFPESGDESFASSLIELRHGYRPRLQFFPLLFLDERLLLLTVPGYPDAL